MAKSNKLLMYGGIIALVLLVGAMVGIVNIPSFSVTGDGTKDVTTSTGTNVPISCNSATSNAISFAIQDEYGNDITSDYNFWYSVNGNEKAQQIATTTITVSPGNVISYVATDKDTTHDVYGFTGNVTAECATTQSVTLKKGMQDTALSLTAYDVSSGADTANDVGSATAIGAGATLKEKLFIAATTNDGVWSTSESGRTLGVAIDYNSLVYKQPVITSVDAGTATLLSGVPNGHSLASATTSTAFYEIKSDALKDLGNLTLRLQAEALTGSTNPSSIDGNIVVTVYDAEMYQRTGTRTWSVGYRNADTSADVGETNSSSTFYTS